MNDKARFSKCDEAPTVTRRLCDEEPLECRARERSEAKPRPPAKAQQRAFVVLIVLVVLAILSAVVVAQFSVVTNNTVIGVRSADDAKARALAESCLTMLQSYADADLGSPIPVGKDFDQVLNPDDSAAINGDEFVPAARAGETVVTLPKGITGTPDFVQRHRWLLIPQTVGTARGACLVRFDDNSDETRPIFTLPTGIVDDVGEGLLSGSTTDIPFKDRDRAIYLSAIGLFPFLPSTAAVDAYGDAHARVTLRRLYNTSSTGSPTILAGGDLSGIKGALCSGGVGAISKTVGVFKSAGPTSGGGCGCGALIAEASTPDPPASTCTVTPACPCAPVSRTTATFDTAALNAKLSAAKPPGDWTAASAVNFIFDSANFGPSPLPGGTTPAPAVNMGATDLGGGKATCKLHFSKTGEVFVWDRFDNTNGCNNYTTTPVERPCLWDGGNPGSLVSCTGPQTRCWRRVFNGGAGPIDWKPSSPIPNLSSAKNWGGAPPSVTYLCGDNALTAPITNCSDCTAAAAAPFAAKFTAGLWTMQNTTDADIPSPSYIAIENASTTTSTIVNAPGNGASMLHASIIANGKVDIDGDANICGAGCDCSPLGSPPTIASCSLSDANVTTVAGESCSVVRAFGTCSASSAPDTQIIVGDMTCGAIDNDKDNVCNIGDISAMSIDPALACGTGVSAECPGDAHFCWKQQGDVVGNVYAATNIGITKEATFSGTVVTQKSFCAEKDVTVTGSMILGLNGGFKGASTMITGAGGISVNALRAMVETAW